MASDCYFFLFSSCSRGSSCSFRHCDAARITSDVCVDWMESQCISTACKKRHFMDDKSRETTECYWEKQPSGCTKKFCPYVHTKKNVSSSSRDTIAATSTINALSKKGLKPVVFGDRVSKDVSSPCVPLKKDIPCNDSSSACVGAPQISKVADEGSNDTAIGSKRVQLQGHENDYGIKSYTDTIATTKSTVVCPTIATATATPKTMNVCPTTATATATVTPKTMNAASTIQIKSFDEIQKVKRTCKRPSANDVGSDHRNSAAPPKKPSVNNVGSNHGNSAAPPKKPSANDVVSNDRFPVATTKKPIARITFDINSSAKTAPPKLMPIRFSETNVQMPSEEETKAPIKSQVENKVAPRKRKISASVEKDDLVVKKKACIPTVNKSEVKLSASEKATESEAAKAIISKYPVQNTTTQVMQEKEQTALKIATLQRTTKARIEKIRAATKMHTNKALHVSLSNSNNISNVMKTAAVAVDEAEVPSIPVKAQILTAEKVSVVKTSSLTPPVGDAVMGTAGAPVVNDRKVIVKAADNIPNNSQSTSDPDADLAVLDDEMELMRRPSFDPTNAIAMSEVDEDTFEQTLLEEDYRHGLTVPTSIENENNDDDLDEFEREMLNS